VSESTPADFFRLNLDVLWGGGERLAGYLGRPVRDHILPSGDGRTPVLTIPGFLAPEYSLGRLNRTLGEHGFVARSWGRGLNLGPRGMSIFDHVEEIEAELGGEIRVMAETAEHKVALVGQSLGGVYARELAHRLPDHVERVITLGSPAIDPDNAHHLNKLLRMVGRRFSGRRLAELTMEQSLLHWDAHDPPMPLVAIYSPVDRIVPEFLSRIPDDIVEESHTAAPRENIAIVCSHSGMAVNPFVILAVLDRLVQPLDEWEGFDPADYFTGTLRLWPTPFRHSEDDGAVSG
jgi:pimeloyl-ACP methyl ester carboxylesterase